MTNKLKALALAALASAAFTITATAASSATFYYNLLDNPNGTETSKGYDYGLRLDDYSRFFSFENGASATLEYNSSDGTAVISGTMRESLGYNADETERLFGELWTVSYSLSSLTDLGNGQFKDIVGTGSGSISIGGSDPISIALSNKERPGDGYFFLTNGSRGDPDQSFDTLVGEGWVGGSDTQDFLFLAELNPFPPGGPQPVPLPAAAWMLIAGLGGMGALRKLQRRKPS